MTLIPSFEQYSLQIDQVSKIESWRIHNLRDKLPEVRLASGRDAICPLAHILILLLVSFVGMFG